MAMQFELTSELLDSLKKAVEEKDSAYLNAQLAGLYAPDIALIINQLNAQQAAYIYELLDDAIAPNVLLELDDDKSAEPLATYSSMQMTEPIDQIASDCAPDAPA